MLFTSAIRFSPTTVTASTSSPPDTVLGAQLLDRLHGPLRGDVQA